MHPDRRIAAWLFLGFLCFYLSTTSGHPPYGDEETYIGVAENILRENRPTITVPDPQPGGLPYRIEYSKFDIGQSLLELPFAALAGIVSRTSPALQRPAQNLLPAAECAMLAALIFLFCRLGDSPLLDRKGAILLAASAGAASQLWPSSQTHFADTSASAMLVLAIYLLVRGRSLGNPVPMALASALSLSIAFLCKSIYIAAAPALAAFTVWSLRRHRQGARSILLCLLAAAVPLLAAIAAHLWYNHLRYGGFLASGYSQGRDGALWFSTPIWVGIYGILFSAGRGFFFYSPLCILFLFGISRFIRERRPELLLVGGAALPLLLIYAKWWSWGGGWEWGTRFHLFLVPLLAWISAPAWRAIRLRSARAAAVAGLFLAGAAVQLTGVLIHPERDWRILSIEIEIQRRVFLPEEIEMTRDGSLLGHFIPECSPIPVHAWLVWATLNRERLTERELALASPYAQYDPRWAPARVAPYLGFNPWALTVWENHPAEKTPAAAALACLALGVAVCGWKTVSLARKY